MKNHGDNNTSTIMLIDNNDIDLFIHQKVLQFVSPGCNVIVFQSGINALKILKSNFENKEQLLGIPDFIVIDLYMPLFDGFDFLKEYESIRIHKNMKPPIIVLTCSINPQDQIKCREYRSVTAFISKPLSKNSIANHLSS